MKIEVLTDIGPIPFSVSGGGMKQDFGWSSAFNEENVNGMIAGYKEHIGVFNVRCLRKAYAGEIEWQLGEDLPDALTDLVTFQPKEKVRLAIDIDTEYLSLCKGTEGMVLYELTTGKYRVNFDEGPLSFTLTLTENEIEN